MATTGSESDPNVIGDSSNWMSNLPPLFKTRPIHTIALPGSHDSFTYSISAKNEVSPDEPDFQCFNQLPCIGPIAKHVIYNWSLTQHKTCTQQLEIGIRYFDFRLAPTPKTNIISSVHGLFGIPVENTLKELREFLRTHPKEIVLLDFQHFYRLSLENHEWLISSIQSIFSSILCPASKNLNELTLEYLWNRNYQVLVFYRCDQCPIDFWSSGYIPNPWPNTDNGDKLLQFLQVNYENGRPANKFYVTQGILTPDKKCVMEHLFSNLEKCLCEEANSLLLAWLQDKVAGEKGLNVVMCDFVGCSNDLVNYIIEINYK